jgi:RNA polymerase sigma-70 factor (ECF subfamily)
MAGGLDGSRMLLACAGAEERQRLLAELFTRQRGRLRIMIEVRLDPRLRSLVDPSALLEEVLQEASRTMGDYLRAPRIPLFLWLHSLTAHKLREVHRLRLGALEVPKEICLGTSVLPQASPAVLAQRLLAKEGGPGSSSEPETIERIRKILEGMGAIDREILSLKHFERLTNAEAALVLGIGERTANGRHLYALRRIKEILAAAEGKDRGAVAG